MSIKTKSRSDKFFEEFYQKFKDELTVTVLLKFFQKR